MDLHSIIHIVKGDNRMDGLRRLWAASSGTVVALGETFNDLLLVIAVFMVMDTLTGVWFACVDRKLWSRALLVGFISKIIAFGSIMTLGYGLTVITGKVYWIEAAALGLVAIEGLSIVENLSKLQKRGVSLGPVQGYIEKVSKYFLHAQEETKKEPGP